LEEEVPDDGDWEGDWLEVFEDVAEVFVADVCCKNEIGFVVKLRRDRKVDRILRCVLCHWDVLYPEKKLARGELCDRSSASVHLRNSILSSKVSISEVSLRTIMTYA